MPLREIGQAQASRNASDDFKKCSKLKILQAFRQSDTVNLSADLKLILVERERIAHPVPVATQEELNAIALYRMTHNAWVNDYK